jgi:hypothetical protein
MYIRGLSYIIHQQYSFYAHNVSIIPVYNKLFHRGNAFIPAGYNGDTCYIDPDLPIYRHNWIEGTAKNIKETLEIVNWVKLNGGASNLSLESWLSMDLFMREAVKIAGNEVASEHDKMVREKETKLEQKLEAAKDYKSPFEGAPKPSFIP